MKGLLEAVKIWLPYAEHRLCTRHIYANFKKRWSGLHYRRLFWSAAATTTRIVFEQRMEEIRQLDQEAFNYLMEKVPATWCRAFFGTNNSCAAFENGVSESFNSRILNARGKPIITMLEDIRIYIMQRIWNMSMLASECQDTICPSIRKEIESLKKRQR